MVGLMPSRPVGRLLDLEYDILESTLAMSNSHEHVYGFALARRLSSSTASAGLVGHGTLYKALGRLTAMGLLQAKWESVSEESGRPRRRRYSVTGLGQLALAARPEAVRPLAVKASLA
jgi:PadR family transcriptional regulator PadR